MAPKAELNSSVLGEIALLMTQSDLHREWPIASLMQWVIPALLNNQYRLYRIDDKPVGYVSWAWLSAEVETTYVRNPRSLQPKDWQSGDRGWILDFVAPFGNGLRIGHDLKHNIFANDVGRFLRVKEGSDTMNITYIHGVKAIQKAQDWQNNPTVDLGAGTVEPEKEDGE